MKGGEEAVQKMNGSMLAPRKTSVVKKCVKDSLGSEGVSFSVL